jgi:hypothetical protein
MATFSIVTYEEFTAVISDLKSEIERLRNLIPPPQTSPLMTPREAADYCRITPESLNRVRRSGRLRGVKANEKEYAYYQHELDAYLKRYNRI